MSDGSRDIYLGAQEQRLLRLAGEGDSYAKGQLIELWTRQGHTAWDQQVEAFCAGETWRVVRASIKETDGMEYAIVQSNTYPCLWCWHELVSPAVSPWNVFMVTVKTPNPADLRTFHDGVTICRDLAVALLVVYGHPPDDLTVQYLDKDKPLHPLPTSMDSVNELAEKIAGERITECFAGQAIPR